MDTYPVFPARTLSNKNRARPWDGGGGGIRAGRATTKEKRKEERRKRRILGSISFSTAIASFVTCQKKVRTLKRVTKGQRRGISLKKSVVEIKRKSKNLYINGNQMLVLSLINGASFSLLSRNQLFQRSTPATHNNAFFPHTEKRERKKKVSIINICAKSRVVRLKDRA